MWTWQLWQTLHGDSLRHPLFKLSNHQKLIPNNQPGKPWRRWIIDFLPVTLLVMIVVGAWLLALLTIAGLVLILLTGGFIYGLIAVIGISRDLARHRTGGRYDLIALSPGGVYGANQAVAASFLQRVRLLNYLRGIMNYLYVGAAILLPLIMLIALMFTSRPITKYSENLFEIRFFPIILNAMLVAGLHYLDFTRSALTGTLTGMITPTYTGGSGETRFIALLFYLTIQVTVYTVFWTIGIVTLNHLFNQTDNGTILIVSGLRLGLMLILREITLRGLWYLLLWRLNISQSEALATLKT
ncbi:MAG TPA: hypothetical protein VHL11_20005 [Phototrophicaceae bacterium]|jgi:hypothetical protein|nr:hypothetical protein [Phototrophicaceae bacterium]